ncbi:MAG: hypothetical protein MMC33_003397 [Icmadophila ericetorum]|nr:hypothetical protein [Icmadophila ericetorum]
MDGLFYLKYIKPNNDHVAPTRSMMSASPSQQTGSLQTSRTHTPSTLPTHISPSTLTRAALQNESSNESEATAVPLSSTSLPRGTEEQSTENPPPNTTLSPFFTLVEDVQSSEHYHPVVHYIFSDDESDLITDAALRIHENAAQQDGSKTATSGSRAATLELSESAVVKERYIILDLAADGTEVVSAQSMTPDWQVLCTEITPAPTLDGSTGDRGSGTEDGKGKEKGKGMMLRVVGTEARKPVEVAEAERLGLEGLVDEYAKRMEELRRVVEGMGLGEGVGLGTDAGAGGVFIGGGGIGKGKEVEVDTGDTTL